MQQNHSSDRTEELTALLRPLGHERSKQEKKKEEIEKKEWKEKGMVTRREM